MATDDALEFVTELMAQRDDLTVPDDVAARIKGKRVAWAYMQGYIEAVCSLDGLDLAECEAEYRRIQQAAKHGERGLDKIAKIAAQREP